MQSFADVLRSLLVRIRALEASTPATPSPSDARALYRVAPTTWGVAPADSLPAIPETSDVIAGNATRAPRRRRRLEIPIFRLPVPRGLPAT